MITNEHPIVKWEKGNRSDDGSKIFPTNYDMIVVYGKKQHN
jgi:hypothetical protein